MSVRVFGREQEVRRIVELIDAAPDMSGALLIEGAPGAGKSSLLQLAITHAVEQGWAVTSARPTLAESTLGFAVLADLVHGADIAALPDLPRRLLETAIGLRAPTGEPPTSAELGLAVLHLLQARPPGAAPLVIVVDDLQWADAATQAVLTFVMRRLPPVGVCVLASRRTAPVPPDVPAEVSRMQLGPLAPAAIERVVRSSLAAPVPDHLVDRLVAAADGNPLFATELGRTAVATKIRPGEPLPMPASLGSAIAQRLRPLPLPTRESLCAVAMLARPTIGVLSELDLLDALLPAEVAQIVRIDGRTVSFTHPLLASAAYDETPATRRLTLRARLAGVTSGVERSIHLALGSAHADPTVAAELTAAAVAEIARGASMEAADLALLAIDATPAGDDRRWERLLLAADALFRSGRTSDAVARLEEAAAEPTVRAKALLALARIEYERSDDAETSVRIIRQVLHATDDPDLLAEAHTALAHAIYTDFVEAAEHADAALAIIRGRDAPDAGQLAEALNAAASTRFRAGEGLDRAAFEQAIHLEAGSAVPAAHSAFGALAALLKVADELDEARSMLESLAEHADPGSLPYALSHLPQIYLWTGQWDRAESCARRHLDYAEAAEQEAQANQARFNLALVAVHRGDVAAAARIGRALYDEGHDLGIPWTERNGAALLGLVAMTSNDPTGAVAMFSRYDDLGESMRLREPGYCRYDGDYMEALVATGQVERATELIDRVEQRATHTGRISALAAVERGRALVASHRGGRDDAFDNARAAVALLDGSALVYDRARSLLTLGLVARRFKDRGAGGQALSAALVEFERMGAASLAERTRRELDRVTGRRTSAGGTSALTVTETRVAERAAAGDTTRQIADALFVSTKTVEANLTRIYRKLGLTNRAQLANHLTRERLATPAESRGHQTSGGAGTG